MKLKRLIAPLESVKIFGSKEIEITGLCSHSQFVSPGNLFVAKKGLNHDGSRFVNEAVAAGASAVLSDFYDPFLDVSQVVSSDVGNAEAILAAHYYGHPSKHLKVIGVTGTNGKTTVSFLIQHMLEKLGCLTGLIGTVEWRVAKQSYRATGTTPDVITCHKLLREMVNAGCRAAVLEVSSHGLSQGRVAQIEFHTAAFTNLSPEHLDYHGNMEAYAKAKSSLFEGLSGKAIAVLNKDDPTQFLTHACKLSYGMINHAELMAKDITITNEGVTFTAIYEKQRAHVSSELMGRFNISNLLAAISVGLGLGFSLKDCVESLKKFRTVKGRFERVKNAINRTLIVDYAHTPDALKNVLMTVRDFGIGKVIVVFGAGGERDHKKRPLMGEVAESLSDVSILTSDNPRTEDPQKIAFAIASGFRKNTPLIELDRRRAIAKAISISQEGDVIVIAGKGHETGQTFAHQVFPFDDVKIASQLCKEFECVCKK